MDLDFTFTKHTLTLTLTVHYCFYQPGPLIVHTPTYFYIYISLIYVCREASVFSGSYVPKTTGYC